MRKRILTSIAVAALFAGAMLVASMRSQNVRSDVDLDTLLSMSAAAQTGGVYVNVVDLVIIPSEVSKFVEAIKENAAASVKEPGCREFNVFVLANRPNHVVLIEIYDNEAALASHRNTDHYKKFFATAGNMIADRSVRAMSVIAMNSKGRS